MKKFFNRLFAKESRLTTDEIISRKTFISFFFFFVFGGTAIWLFKWLQRQPLDGGIRGGIPQPLRDGLDKNEKIFNKLLDDKHLAKEYSKPEAVQNVRVNGDVGVGNDFDPSEWKLSISKAKGDILEITLDEIKRLPKTEVIFNFKCIEGWNQVSWWGGVRFSDFADAYKLKEECAMKYLGLSTPDEEYYVGIDMPSALHPQTLLCYEMNGKPLPMEHGYPLRLIIPVKYGVKSLKRIGNMYFDNERTPDYWAERGYDYFVGL